MRWDSITVIVLEVALAGQLAEALPWKAVLRPAPFFILTRDSHWPLGTFLLSPSQGLPVALMDVFVGWPGECKRNCFLSK